jgi:hypothetical protein
MPEAPGRSRLLSGMPLPPFAAARRSPFSENGLKGCDVQFLFGQQALELGILALKLSHVPDVGNLDTTVFPTPAIEGLDGDPAGPADGFDHLLPLIGSRRIATICSSVNLLVLIGSNSFGVNLHIYPGAIQSGHARRPEPLRGLPAA